MKKIALTLAFAVLGIVAAQAQDSKSDNYPVWSISKGVQQLQFKNVAFVPAKITTTNQVLVSKGVQSIHQQNEVKGKVVMAGTPAWTISKGVARFQYEATR